MRVSSLYEIRDLPIRIVYSPHSDGLSHPFHLIIVVNTRGYNQKVTGGGTGIGLMMTRALANAGAAKVYIAGRRLDVLQSAAASIGKPDVVVPITCDVTSSDSLTALVDHIEKDAGYLNLLLCNSGVGGPQVPAPPPPSVPASSAGAGAGDTPSPPSIKDWAAQHLAIPMVEYERTFSVNVTSVWYTTMACLELLDKGNKAGNLSWSSQVVVTSSIGGFNRKAPGGYAYGQSKAAATHAAKQLAVVLPTWGIRANCLAPGLFPSEMSAPIVKGYGGDPGSGESVPIDKNAVPLGRTGDESDMAGTILYMVSRAGAYCNGNVVVVDGGRLGTVPATY